VVLTARPLTPERILDVTEGVLRRYGPAKATVVDVARELAVGHGSVYRHFATKTALREAVTKRWLDRAAAELSVIAADGRAPESRLRDWLAALFAGRRRTSGEDPELFATHQVLAGDDGDASVAHREELLAQLARIVRSGVDSGAFRTIVDPVTTARAVFQATARFHEACHSGDWERPDIEAQFDAVVELVVRGLRA
jgi:AcrR family transcriptional regulator